MQSDAVNEVHVYDSLRLSKAYQFEPMPAGVDPNFIRGGQANLWTEQIFNFRQVEYMLWPRAFAIAETVWSPDAKKDWNHFYPKVEEQFARLDAAEIKYATSVYSPIFTAKINAQQQLEVTLTTEIPNLDLYYSFDNSYPDNFYPLYAGPIVVPEDATQLRVATYRGKQMLGRIITMPIAQLRRRVARSEPQMDKP
jgi:hexosaminidase